MERIHLAKKQGRNSAADEKEIAKNLPVFTLFDMIFPVFVPYLLNLNSFGEKKSKIFGA